MDEENIDINNVEIDKLQEAIANIAENSEKSYDESLKNPMEIMEKLDDPQEEENVNYKKYVLKIDKKYKDIIDKMTLEEREEVNIEIKYEGYIKLQMEQIEQFKKLEKKTDITLFSTLSLLNTAFCQDFSSNCSP